MKRHFDRARGSHPLDTFSAFARESLKGYIYIEAKRQAHVQEAINNIPNLYMTTLMLVPLKDMVDAINVQKKDVDIPLGGWVRIKRGTYTGDLAQVVEVSDSQDSARVKVVPRLDLENAGQLNDEDGKKRKKAVRPPPRLFNPERLPSRSISSLQKKGPYWVYNGDHYRDGYLEKYMKVAVLQLEDVNPTLDEIARFAGNEINGEDGERAIDLSTLSTLTINSNQTNNLLFQPGDTVSVVEGDMIHSTGIVENVLDSSVVVSLKVDGSKKRVTLPAKQLRKKFKEGDHVKVINGRYRDESGMVVKVEENIVTLLSDATLKEVRVFSKDLREAADVMFGKTVIGNYELHDLVQLE
jgi:transcription elongation factor SPT5